MYYENNKPGLDIVKSKAFHLTAIFLILLIQSVQAQNEPVVTDETFTIDEHPANNFGSINGAIVGTVTANDPDGDNLSYSITDGNTDGAFNINSSSGEISVANDDAIDFETNPIFTLTIEVTDDEASPKSGTGTITVELNDISPNDLCTNAITIDVGTTVSGSTSDASRDTYIVSNCGTNAAYGFGVWYHLAGNGETIILSTCNGDKYGFDDTSLSVYSGSCTTELACIAGNEDTGIKGECGRWGEQASLKFASEPGVDYYIFLDGSGMLLGDFDLTTSSVSKGMSIDPVLGIFTWSPTAAQAGTHTVEVTVSDGTFSDSETIAIAVVLTVGVDDPLKHEFVIYPNPVASTLYLSLDNNYRGEVLVRVLSMSGEEQITRRVMKSKEKLRDQLDIVMKAGAYLLEVRMPGSEKLGKS